MSRAALLIGAGLGLAAVVLLNRGGNSGMDGAAEDGGLDVIDSLDTAADGFFDELMEFAGGFMPVGLSMDSQNLKAFLSLIRSGESSLSPDAYRMLYGGKLFEGFADHPRKYFSGPAGRTSAAGAYQITATTWDDLRKNGWASELPDFSPASQDKAAVILMKRRGALADVVAGRWASAIRRLTNEWTSLPGAAEARYSLEEAKRRLALYGGGRDSTMVV